MSITTEELKSFLVEKYNNSELHENQLNAACELIKHVGDSGANKFSYLMLFSLTQVGKTGTMLCTASTFLCKYPDWKVYIISGMSDITLKKQLMQEVRNKMPHKIASKVRVLFNDDIRKCNDFDDKDDYKYLILIDESHYGSDKHSTLDTLLRDRLRIGTLGTTTMSKRQIVIVSVTATCGAENIQNNTFGEPKHRVILHPGIGYVGLQDLYDNNRILMANSLISNEEIKEFTYIASTYKGRKQYAIVRVPSDRKDSKYADMIVNSLTQADIPFYKLYDKSEDDNLNTYICNPPYEFTVLLIKNRCRAGVVVDTTNICMMWERTTRVEENQSFDAVIQGLPGRATGYNKKLDIDIYCNVSIVEQYLDYVNSGYDPDFVPEGFKNVSLHKNRLSKSCIGTCEFTTEQQALSYIKSLYPGIKRKTLVSTPTIAKCIEQKREEESKYPGCVCSYVNSKYKVLTRSEFDSLDSSWGMSASNYYRPFIVYDDDRNPNSSKWVIKYLTSDPVYEDVLEVTSNSMFHNSNNYNNHTIVVSREDPDTGVIQSVNITVDNSSDRNYVNTIIESSSNSNVVEKLALDSIYNLYLNEKYKQGDIIYTRDVNKDPKFMQLLQRHGYSGKSLKFNHTVAQKSKLISDKIQGRNAYYKL